MGESQYNNIKILYNNKKRETILNMFLHLINIEYDISKDNNIKKLVKESIDTMFSGIYNKIKNKEQYEVFQSCICAVSLNKNYDKVYSDDYNNCRNIISILVFSLVIDTLLDLDQLNNETYINDYNRMEKYISCIVEFDIDEMLSNIFDTIKSESESNVLNIDKNKKIITDIILCLINIKYGVLQNNISKELINKMIDKMLNEICNKIKDRKIYTEYQIYGHKYNEYKEIILNSFQIDCNNCKKYITQLVLGLINDVILDLYQLNNICNTDTDKYNIMQMYINYIVTSEINRMLNEIFDIIKINETDENNLTCVYKID